MQLEATPLGSLQDDPLAPAPKEDIRQPMKAASSDSLASSGQLGDLQRVYIKSLPECDYTALREIVKAFVCPPVFQMLKEATNYLRQTIQLQKKGLSQRMKSLFKSNPANSQQNSIPVPQFSGCNIIMSHQRKLADVLAISGDFEGAGKAYQQFTSEVKSDKLTLAFNYEMQGAMAIFDAQPSRQADACFDNAFSLYLGAGEKGLAVRCTIFCMAYNMVHNMYQRAYEWALRVMALPKLNPLTTVLLHEQAAFSLLRSPSHRYRKVSSMFVNVGYKYSQLDTPAVRTTPAPPPRFGHHAYRCYKLAYPNFADKGWSNVEDFLHLQLVRHSFTLGLYDDAELYLRRLFEHNVQAPSVHNTLLRELLFIYEHRAAAHPVVSISALPELPFPIEQQSSFVMKLNDDPPDCSASDMCAFRDTRWNTVSRTRRVAYVDEVVTVQVDVSNPLQVPIQLSQVHSMWDFQPSGELPKQALLPFSACFSDVLLCPGEKTTLSLPVSLAMTGTMRICGFAFDVFNRVWGMRRFSFLPQTHHGKSSKRNLVDPDVLIVAPPMPRIVVEFDGFPDSVIDGEIVPLVMRIRNISASVPATRIRVAFSHAEFFVFDKAHCKIAGVDGVMENAVLDSDQAIISAMGDDAFSTLTWMDITGLEVPPDGVAELPFLFRAYGNSNTRYLFHTAVAYRSPDTGSSAVRFAHAHNELTVRPSLRIHQQMLPNPSAVDSMVLRVRVDNIMPSRVLIVDQLSCLSRRWTIRPIVDKSKLLFSVKPGESVNYVFHVRSEPLPDEQEPDSFLLACMMSGCTNPEESEIDVLRDSSLLFVGSESYARWEAGELGPAPKTKNNQQRANTGDDDNHENAAFGLSSFGALPSYVNAHLRADNTPIATKVPDLDIITLHWSASPEEGGKQEPTKGFSIMSQQASQSIPNLANMQCPVRLCVKAPSLFKHDFSTEPLCMVPVTVTARNYSTSRNLRVSFDALTPNNTASGWFVTIPPPFFFGHFK